MSEENKPIKVEFAPGAFDAFEGTQEELDALQKEIMDMFANLTPEELAERSRTVSFEELEEDEDITDEQLEQIFRTVTSSSNRTLQ